MTEFTRQKWRVWIETWRRVLNSANSTNSPARNGGCGLKPSGVGALGDLPQIHPPEMAGVD